MSDLRLKHIPLNAIQHTARNPRSDPDADLDGLAASLGRESAPNLVQPPVVEDLGDGTYRILAGERRIRAARKAEWVMIECLVRPRTDPLVAHTLRLAENMHRRELHPLDQAAALKIAWLAANAEEMELGEQVRSILAEEQPPNRTLEKLQAFMEQSGFTPTCPAVLWDDLLDRLGVSLNMENRKKLLGVLSVDTRLQEQVRTLDVTAAGLRAIGRLDADDQKRLVEEIAKDPDLGQRVRRIARTVHEGTRTLDEALAEARGEATIPGASDEPGKEASAAESAPDATGSAPPSVDDQVMQSVVALLELANKVDGSIRSLKEQTTGEGFASLPSPWNEYATSAVEILRTALAIVEGG